MDNITQGAVVAIIGVCTVFTVLAILWGVLELMRIVFSPKGKKAEPAKKAPAPAPAPVAPSEPIAVKPQEPAPAQRQASSFYSDIDFQFLQRVAMRKNPESDK